MELARNVARVNERNGAVGF